MKNIVEINNNIYKIKQLIDNIFNEYRSSNEKTKAELTDTEILISFLDEIESMAIQCNNELNVIKIFFLDDENISSEFNEINPKLHYVTFKCNIDNSIKMLYERIKLLCNLIEKETNTKITLDPIESSSRNQNSHEVSNNIKFYIEKKHKYNKSDIESDFSSYSELILKLTNDIITCLYKNVYLKDKYSYDFIKKIRKNSKINGDREEVLIKKYIHNSEEFKKKLDNIKDRFLILLFECKNEKSKIRITLLVDVIFRVYETIHILQYNKKIKNNYNMFLKCDNHLISLMQNDYIVNSALTKIMSCYDKLSKELANNEEIYFSQIRNNKQEINIRNCYKSIEFIKNNISEYYNLIDFQKELSNIRNLYAHYIIPLRLASDELSLEIYSDYKTNIIIINSKFIINILNFILKYSVFNM